MNDIVVIEKDYWFHVNSPNGFIQNYRSSIELDYQEQLRHKNVPSNPPVGYFLCSNDTLAEQASFGTYRKALERCSGKILTIDSSKMPLMDLSSTNNTYAFHKMLVWTGLTRYNSTHFKDEKQHLVSAKSMAVDSGWDENYFNFPEIFIATVTNT